jgi:hypothetical protein
VRVRVRPRTRTREVLMGFYMVVGDVESVISDQ